MNFENRKGDSQVADNSRPEPETGTEPDRPKADTQAEEQRPAPAPDGDDGPTGTEDAGAGIDAAEDSEPDESGEDADQARPEQAPAEADAEPAPETPSAQPPEPAPEQTSEKTSGPAVERRGGLLPMLIGGIVAAALGGVIARSPMLDPWLPAGWRAPDYGSAIAELQRRSDDQATAVSRLRQRIEALKIPDLAPLEGRIETLAGQVSPLGTTVEELASRLAATESRLDDLDARLTEVEKRPLTESASPAAVAAYERELAALRESLAAQRAEVEQMIASARAKEAEARGLEEKAAEQARLAAIRNMLARLRGALDDGAPYAQILDDLSAAGLAVPAELAAQAADGVATMAALRESFPPAARAALAAVRAENGGKGGIGAFLKRQLGMRSVAPRAGDDPDAILSRAEAALVEGRLADALSEISALPPVARDALAEWEARAAARQSALVAADALARSLNSN